MTRKYDVERIRGMWDRNAPGYDRGMRMMERFLLKGAREWVCSRAHGDTLEVAVGTGLNLPFYPATATLTGTDLSPAMIALARRRATETGRDITLLEAGADDLPFPDGSFDTVVCTLALCSVPDDRAAITEMHRVLRPGGQLLLLDHVVSSNVVIRAGQRLVERVTIRNSEYQTRRPLLLLADVGFVVEDSHRSKAGTIERLRARKPGPA